MNTKKVTLTKKEILNYQQGLGYILEAQELGAQKKYWIGKKIRPLIDEAETLNKIRQQEQMKIARMEQELQTRKQPLNGQPDTLLQEYQNAQEQFQSDWEALMEEEVTLEVPVLTIEELEKADGVLERNQQGQVTKRGKPTVRIMMQLDWMITEPAD
jgi:hypothetical protein